MQFLKNKNKFILTLVLALSFVSFSSIASTSLPFQVQTELVLTNSHKDVDVFSYVVDIEIFQSKLLNSFANFDFDCFLTFIKHNNLINYKRAILKYYVNKRDLEMIRLNPKSNLKEDHIQKHFIG